MPILYDHANRPIVQQKLPERNPLPLAPLLSSQRDYVTDGLDIERLATLLRLADTGHTTQQAELFAQLVEKDCHLSSEEQKRINGISSQHLEWSIEPASDSQRDLDVRDFIQKELLEHDEWDDYLLAKQQAVCRGYAGIEPLWDISSGQAVIGSYRWTEPERLIFQDPKTGLLSPWPVLATDQNPQGEELPPWSMILHKQGGLAGSAVRSALLRPCSWMVVLKHYAAKDWWIFSELAGVPLRLGIYDSASSPKDRAALEQAVQGVGVDFAATISANTKIEFVQAAKNVSGAQLWELQLNFCNNEMSKAIIGSSAFAEAGKSGSYAIDTLETGVRADLTLADAKSQSCTDSRQVVTPLVGFNWGWDTANPKVVVRLKRQENLKIKSEWLEPVANRIPDEIPADWYRAEYGIPKIQGSEQSLAAVAVTVTHQDAALILAKANAPKPSEAAQLEVDALAGAGAALVDLEPVQAAILQLVQASSNFDELYAGLAALYPDLDLSQMEQVLRASLLMAESAGVEVVQDAKA